MKKIYLIPIFCVLSINAATSGPVTTPTPTDSMETSEVTRKFSGIRIVLENNLVENVEYKDFFVRAIRFLADVDEDVVQNFAFNDKGSDLILESLEARNMSMYELTFQITLGSRSMSEFKKILENATKTSHGDTSCALLDKVNEFIAQSLFPSGGMHNTTEIHIDRSSFVAWTRDFTKMNDCFWPLNEYVCSHDNRINT